MITLREQYGTGYNSNPKYFQLRKLDIDMDSQTILIRFDTYTEIQGKRFDEIKGLQYVVEDLRALLDINGSIIPDTDNNGNIIYLLDENNQPTQNPQPRIDDFTYLINTFSPSLWNQLIVTGIKKYLGIYQYP
ncbi:hypothetical protein KA025_02510 [Candidatus Saccharibacteria bacterium]|nr:hypothetical protein [Candidatus Saccharibacteria bacterium]